MKQNANPFKRNSGKQIFTIAASALVVVAIAVTGVLLLIGGSKPSKAYSENLLDNTKLAAGGYHSLAIDGTGNLWAWGDNSYGQLGDGTNNPSYEPMKIEGNKYIAVSAGECHSLAIDIDGRLWAWGLNNYGQLGDGSYSYSDVPLLIGDNRYTAISAGAYHSLAIDENGVLWAWGWSVYGQVGNGSVGIVFDPVPIDIGGNKCIAVSAGYWHSLAIDESGDIWAWGRNDYWQLGNGNGGAYATNPGAYVAAPIRIGGTYIAIAAGRWHSLAMDDSGYLWTWGLDELGQLGNGIESDKNSPSRIKIGDGYKQDDKQLVAIAAGGNHCLAIDKDGYLWAWGEGSLGQLGLGSNYGESTPQCADVIKYTAIAAGSHFNGNDLWSESSHSLAMDADHGLWACGRGTEGQLGDGYVCDNNYLVFVKDMIGIEEILMVFFGNGGRTSYNETYIRTTYSYGEAIGWLPSASTFIYGGYTFKGWYNAASGGTQVTTATVLNATNFWIDMESSTPAVSVYAQWTANSYTVTFNTGGATSGVPGASSITGWMVDTYRTLPTAGTMARTGYTFAGWGTQTNGLGTALWAATDYVKISGQANSPGWYGNINITTTTTLYAQWTAKTVTVTFDTNKGDGSSTPTTPGAYTNPKFGSAFGALPATSRDGYLFEGWFTDATGGTQITAATVVNIATVPNETSVTLFAQWTVRNVEITYLYNYDSAGTYETKTVEYDSTYGADWPVDPMRSEYTFDGWNTAANGSGTTITSTSAVNTGVDSTPVHPALCTITLYAQWTGDLVTIEFKLDGYSGYSDEIVTGLPGSEADIPIYLIDIPLKLGTTKYNWIQEGTDTIVAFPMVLENDMTVVLDWVYATFTVKFIADGVTVHEAPKASYGISVSTYFPGEKPTSPGKQFVGWQGYVPGMVVVSNHTFNAVFANDGAATSKLTFIYKNTSGSEISEDISAVNGQKVLLYLPDVISFPDSIFIGWEGFSAGEVVTENKTFRAKYTDSSADIVTIRFVDTDGTLVHEVGATDGTQLWLIVPPAIDKNGKVFENWTTDYTGGTVDASKANIIIYTATWEGKDTPQDLLIPILILIILATIILTYIVMKHKRNKQQKNNTAL